jgi:outer membrane protein
MQGRGGRSATPTIGIVAACAIVASAWLAVAAELPATGVRSADTRARSAGYGANTLDGALVQAYQNNPTLNAQRAAVRAVDESVPQALAGYRPRITANANLGVLYTETDSQAINPATGRRITTQQYGDVYPRGYGVSATQTLYNGFQTGNRTRQAEMAVFQARETLRVIEQTILLDAATAYMNLLRDSAILDLQKRNVEVLAEQLRQTRDRFNVGEVTRTDVAQSESRLAAGRTSLLVAESNYITSQANFRRVIGVEPGRLAAGTPVDRFSPRTLDVAIAQGQAESPSVQAAMYGVDVAALAVKVNEGALYPVLTVTGNIQQNDNPSINTSRAVSASVIGAVTVPIYQGGSEYSLVRQSKETLGQRRIDLDTNRDQARATVVQNWGQLVAARSQIESTQAQVAASEIALNGVREEARVGQRTTLDVLNAQQELVNARVALVTAQRDRVVASFSLLAAVGRLSLQTLAINVPIYDPRVHYHQVRDVWFGVRIPDGK